MDCDVRAVAGNDDPQGPLHVETRQAPPLRREQQHRLEHSGQSGVVDLGAEPAELFLEVAVAVAGGGQQHPPLGGLDAGADARRDRRHEAERHQTKDRCHARPTGG
jgi:hypothetical protein